MPSQVLWTQVLLHNIARFLTINRLVHQFRHRFIGSSFHGDIRRPGHGFPAHIQRFHNRRPSHQIDQCWRDGSGILGYIHRPGKVLRQGHHAVEAAAARRGCEADPSVRVFTFVDFIDPPACHQRATVAP